MVLMESTCHHGSYELAPEEGHLQRGHRIMTSYEFFVAWVRAHASSDRGASLVEYALLVALIAVVCIAAITLLGDNASKKFDSVATSIN